MGSTKFATLALIGVAGALTYVGRPAAQHTVLVGTIGNDTVAVDRFTRDRAALEGVLLIRRPVVHTMHYKATFAPPEGRITHLNLVWRDAQGQELRSAIMSFGIDSIRSQMKGFDIRAASAPPRIDALPIPPPPYSQHAYSMLEHAAIVLQLATSPGAEIEWIAAGSRSVLRKKVTRVTTDTITMEYMAGKVIAQIDPDKRLVSMTIGTTPVMTVVKRSTGDVNITRLTANFATRDTLQRFAP